MKRKRHLYYFVFILLLLMTAASCGLRDNPESESDDSAIQLEQAEDEMIAVAQFHYLQLPDQLESFQGYAINDEWLYLMESQWYIDTDSEPDPYPTKVSKMRISDGYIEQDYITSDIKVSEARAKTFFVDEEGDCYLFWHPNAEEEKYFLEKYGANGELLWHIEYTPEELFNLGDSLSQGTVTEDRVLLYSYGAGGSVFVFSGDGNLEDVYTPELEELQGVAIGADGRAYGYCITGTSPLFTELGGTESYVCPIVPLEVYDGDGEGVCLRTGEGMWRYVPETGETELLWNWEDEYVQIRGDFLDRVFCSSGRYMLLCDEKGGIIMSSRRPLLTVASVSFEDSRQYPARQTITVDVFLQGSILNQVAKLYNREGSTK